MKNLHKYPSNWRDVIRPAILLRDKFKCTDCGAKHRSPYHLNAKGEKVFIDKADVAFLRSKGFKIKFLYLQIAHLDRNPANNDYLNLKAKCPKCHLAYDLSFNLIVKLSKRG